MIDLMPFCDTESSRWSIEKPWAEDGKVFATDGRVLIECDPALYGGELATKDRQPKYKTILAPIKKVKEWHQLPEYDTCYKCDNTTRVECADCDGSAMCICGTCGHEHPCGGCRGTGEVACGCVVMFGERRINRVYANLLTDLPGIEWGIKAKSKDGPVFFRFKGGRGVIMPLVKETP